MFYNTGFPANRLYPTSEPAGKLWGTLVKITNLPENFSQVVPEVKISSWNGLNGGITMGNAKITTMTKLRGPRTAFAHLADEGVRAYQHAQRLPRLTMAMDYLAAEVGVGSSTLGAWRRDVIPTDYYVLKSFVSACIDAAPELGEGWVRAMFCEAKMASFCDQAIAELFAPPVWPQNADKEAALAEDALGKPKTTRLLLGALPTLPACYVPRPAELQRLQTLAHNAQQSGNWGAVLGMTGVGKSTLLAALGHDPAVREAFSGNVRWFEVRQSTTTPHLARHIARSLGLAWPAEVETTADSVAALREVLGQTPVLLLLDNVVHPAVIQPLRALGPNVTVVFTSRSAQNAAALLVPEPAWVTVGEFQAAEAWALVQRIAPAPEEQIAAAREVLELLDYHPYAVVIAASAAVALQMTWPALLTALRTASTRLRTLRLAEPNNAILWLPLELDWERLDPAGRYVLETLGRLPYFSRYTPDLAQAAWCVSAEEAAVLLKELAALQLVRPVGPEGDVRYAVHWLVRDFAQAKAESWTPWQRLRFALWPWRYPLPLRLCWWWPSLPKSETGVSWPWWSSHVPGTEAEPGWRSILAWLATTLWRRGPALNLRAGPDEWASVARLSARFALLALVGLLATLAAYAQILRGLPLPLSVLAVQIAATWGVLVAYADLRRAVLLWGMK